MSPASTGKRWMMISAAIARLSIAGASSGVCGKSFEFCERRAKRAMHIRQRDHAFGAARMFGRFARRSERVEADAARRALQRMRGFAPALAVRQLIAPILHL